MEAVSRRLVWYPEPAHGYAIGRIVDIASAEVSVQPVAVGAARGVQHELLGRDGEEQQPVQRFPYSAVFPCDQLELEALEAGEPGEPPADCDDNCALIQLNEAALLENIRLRFQRDKIYTYVAHILVAVNPYAEVRGLHSPEAILRYQGKSLGTMPPHVYAIADKAYRDMKAFKQSQSIIINGESGAGKTESQKNVLRYLCLSGSQSGRLEKLILDANPLLEAFGNAKTLRNNNSSRFGKFIEIHYSSQLQVTGGLFFHYLLEKSRLCSQSAGERNYHIFYQLCAGLAADEWRALELGPPDQFRYLASGCTQYFLSREADLQLAGERKSAAHQREGAIQDQLIDELKCFEQTERALANFGLTEPDRRQVYSLLAALLHLGNLTFDDDPDDNRGGCRLSSASERHLVSVARLIGLEGELLRQSLVSRIMSTSRAGHKGTVYLVQLSQAQAAAARDALAKAIYSRLFDHLVAKVVNRSIPFASSSYYIGVLDVAGFEYFQQNGYEQFLINFCNERLQQFFNQRILQEEQSIYEKEGLGVKRVEFVDNADCIQLFEAKKSGIFDLLDEESRLPKPSAQHFTQAVHEANAGHPRLAVPRSSKLRQHRELRDHEGFLVRHFAGAVCYQTGSFIEKNNDALHGSLRNLMLEVEHALLRDLFAEQSSATTGGGGGGGGGKLASASVAATFRSQLAELLGKLRATGSHFVRCLKPNNEMEARKFAGGQVLSQLRCSGMQAVLELMQQGYPSRASFRDLYATYRALLPERLARLDSHLFCRALFRAIGLRETDFRFGASKVFFKPGSFAHFDQLLRSERQQVAALVGRVGRWLVGARWRKAQYAALAAVKLARKIHFRRQLLERLQRHWRAALVAGRTRPRLEARKAARAIQRNLAEFEALAAREPAPQPLKLELASQTELLKQELAAFVAELELELQQALEGGRGGESAGETRARCQTKLDTLATKRDLLLRALKDKLAKQRELAQLEQQAAQESRRRQELEVASRREAALQAQRRQLERRRQQELAEQQPIQEEDGERARELAARLAAEPNQPSGRRPPPLAPSQNHAQREECAYQLSEWKYSDLRDTINTSCDLELLEACKREFHRRLKVYHAWRAANAQRNGPASQRAPASLLGGQSGGQAEPQVGSEAQAEQRYFRIPFVKGQARGWWFAHFDGQWIARQLELHPNRAPILLSAGQHDMEMCELSLRETRLTSKRGAEILQQEFDEQWAKHGGQPYLSAAAAAKR